MELPLELPLRESSIEHYLHLQEFVCFAFYLFDGLDGIMMSVVIICWVVTRVGEQGRPTSLVFTLVSLCKVFIVIYLTINLILQER